MAGCGLQVYVLGFGDGRGFRDVMPCRGSRYGVACFEGLGHKFEIYWR